MRNLFTSIAYDLNAHSIVSLKSSLGQTRTLALITTLLASTGLRASGGIKGSTSGKDRKLLARSLFDEFVYDLDHKRIVDFTIKSWAESFLMLRAALYRDEMSEEMKNRFNSGSSNGVSGVSSGGMFFDPNG